MVKRTKKEFTDYNDFHDRVFPLKWKTAYAMDDLVKGIRANEEYAMKSNEALRQMTRPEIDVVLSEAFLKHKEVRLQLNILDELGRLVDSFVGHFAGEAYLDYFVIDDTKVNWADVRHIELVDLKKWSDVDMFQSKDKELVAGKDVLDDATLEVEKNEFYQAFYDEDDSVKDGEDTLE